jgi:hypothetical protein
VVVVVVVVVLMVDVLGVGGRKGCGWGVYDNWAGHMGTIRVENG